jgi:FkbH-like protein
MRILKLVIWDLDETILSGVLEESGAEINPAALRVMAQLRSQGTLQALATYSQSEVLQTALEKFEWSRWFVQTEASLGPKVALVRRILDRLSISPLDTAFIDEDPFERDSIAIQTPGISAWSIAGLQTYINDHPDTVTEEGLRRPALYIEEQARLRDKKAADDYLSFLRRCNIRITIRPFTSQDADRVKELLVRTHRMNLGVLSLEEAFRRLERASDHSVVIAEAKDNYGDMGRCGVLHLRPNQQSAILDSLAMSCRTRARGLSLSMLVGLLRHPRIGFQEFRCRFVSNGVNRPMRMLLMAAGFQRDAGTDELVLSVDRLAGTALPDWINISYS